MRPCALPLRDRARQHEVSKSICYFHGHELWSNNIALFEDRFSPLTAGVSSYERGRNYRCIHDERHLRPASRARRMSAVDTVEWRSFLSSRKPSSQADMSGRDASLISSARRYSCSDLPDAAARAASSSCVSAGSLRIVTDGMHAFCMHSG